MDLLGVPGTLKSLLQHPSTLEAGKNRRVMCIPPAVLTSAWNSDGMVKGPHVAHFLTPGRSMPFPSSFIFLIKGTSPAECVFFAILRFPVSLSRAGYTSLNSQLSGIK